MFSESTHHGDLFLQLSDFENMGVAEGRRTKNAKIRFFSIFKNFLLIFEKKFSISFCLQLMKIQKTFKIQFFRNSKKWAGSFLEPLIMHRIEKTLISRAQLARSARFQAKNRYGS